MAESSSPVALVTGSSRGIGRAIAVSLAKEKFNVVVNFASNAAAAEEVKALIESAGSQAMLVKGDVASATDRGAMVAAVIGAWGRIDLLVNNAGIAPSIRADLLDAGEESFDKLIGTNVKGPYFLTQLVAKQMLSQPPLASGSKPKIVNVSSISAYTASTNRGDYCIAKAAIGMMTQLYAARLADEGINVYEIRPGIIMTDMTGPVKAKYDKLILEDGITPIRRWGQPDDVARAVVAIALDLLPFSTGEVINVDGGFHLRRL